MVVLVTGSSGQLGQSLQHIAPDFPNVVFFFATSQNGDITDKDKLNTLFREIKPDYCINCAAYTAVDKAESEPEKAQLINVTGAKNLAEICRDNRCILVHLSTDFVFDGSRKNPYTETDITNPEGVYGKTKRDGELAIAQMFEQYFIVRTSWVYSEFGNNFMKTMLRLAAERDSISVVNDQIGTPTYAVDLAKALLQLIQSGKKEFGTYHYSNLGVASWYDFATSIFEKKGIGIKTIPIPTTSFPTPAKRPAYSVLDKSKIQRVFSLDIPVWQTSLSQALEKLTS